ncbi:alpha-amylase family glycosyl hydrolase [Novosphingobium sp. Chol11]|uniref:alpha-amylase family glycosyl hydrolase n=1 Tax=Novosphingobium sp. Chol11 TaxID=1385763 RepID=UPI0025F89FFA|nr:alpha-amylase family glycosyl hydrolase [Novosphingobium sp. Chol11]
MNPEQSEPWWKGAVIYQIYPRSFMDANGDGIGDLPGITARLDHVASLGVDGIWLSPFFTSPMRDFGYDIADYRGVDSIFGTLADFDAMCARAHALGLKVIIDQVYSHTSDQHAWFEQSRASRTGPRADWYVWADAKPDGSPPSNWQSVFGGAAWTWDARRGQYYLHNFLSTQADLNVHNPAVQEALLDVARFWLDRGVDGFRLDAINFAMHDLALTDNPPRPEGEGRRTRPFDFQLHVYNQSHPGIVPFLERLRGVIDGYPGDRFTVAEVGGDEADAEMKAFTAGDTRLNSAYGFDFLYAEKLSAALVREVIGGWPGTAGEGWPSWAFSNHDAPRVISRWAAPEHGDAMARLCLLLLFCLRGNIFLYQGEELGLPQAEVPFERLQDPEAIANWPQTLGRDGARTPMPWAGPAAAARAAHGGFSRAEPWLPMPDVHLDLAVDVQERDAASVLNLTRQLAALRRARPELRIGDFAPIETPEPLLVFDRSTQAGALRCVFNLGDAPLDHALEAGWRVIMAVNGAGVGASLPPRSGMIAERVE